MNKFWPAVLVFLFVLQACSPKVEGASSPDTTTKNSTTTSTVPEHADAEAVENPFFSGNKVRVWISPEYANYMNDMLKMLNDKQGWSRIGLSFVSEPDMDLADIVIFPRKRWHEVESLCGSVKGAAGCARYRATIGGEYICSVQSKAPGKTLREEGFLSIINHEIGHCLGVGHSGVSGELMYFALGYRAMREIVYPTERDIEKAKEFIEILKTKTAR